MIYTAGECLEQYFDTFAILTPSVHKTVMRCFSSCTLFTENRIAVFTKYVQLLLDKRLFDFHNWNSLFEFQTCFELFDVKQMWIQFIPVIQNKLQKLAEYFPHFG